MGKPTVAVVGSGVSGMTAAYILSKQFDVTLFDARTRLGGNVDTVEAVGAPPIDMAFTEYNSLLYPEVTRLLDELGIASEAGSNVTDVICTDCGYAQLADTLFGGQNPPARPERVREETWQKFQSDQLAFARRILESGKPDENPSVTLGGVFKQEGYGAYFMRHFLYPRLATWYLGNVAQLEELPFGFLAETITPHLGPDAYLAWRTITGGARTYIEKIASRLAAVHKGTPVRSVRRITTGVEIHVADGRRYDFDKAVLAAPAPETLRMLVDPDRVVQQTLGAFGYNRTEVFLHTDTSVLPPGFSPESAIIMHTRCRSGALGFFHINETQMHRLNTERAYYVSYDPVDTITPSEVLHHSTYKHPTFTPESITAQRALAKLGDHVLAFAGCYHGDGLHEAGCRSGIAAAAKLGVITRR
jgi:uncharacterized protein